MQSFSKCLGPDLRLAAIGGPDDLLAELWPAACSAPAGRAACCRASSSSCWPTPPRQTLAEARTTYATRRGDLTDALHARGVATTAPDGINLWVEVADEQAAAYRLATSGVGVAVGSPFVPNPRRRHDHSASRRDCCVSEVGALADLVAEAAAPPTPRTGAGECVERPYLGCIRMAPSSRMTSPFM